jgi:hypothetical protein
MSDEINLEEVEIEEEKGGFWKKLKPSSLTAYTFEILFLAGLMISLVNFPIGDFMSGNINAKISFGWPLTFFEIDPQNPSNSLPIKFAGLIMDLLIYILVSYLFDLIVSSMGRAYKKTARKIEDNMEDKDKKIVKPVKVVNS